MPLYRVSMTFETFVRADSEDDAVEWLNDNREWLDDLSDGDMSATQVTDVKRVPPEWINSLPWSDHKDERTCEQVIEEGL